MGDAIVDPLALKLRFQPCGYLPYTVFCLRLLNGGFLFNGRYTIHSFTRCGCFGVVLEVYF